MGVAGLWTLLAPVGRPVQLENMEGKKMAIDSSIWLYQFQATMRDKDGRGLVNAHVLGFLRRICKLLFYGIRPVFVFDGGAPVLKKMTITERKKRKIGASLSYARTAEKILAAQMRREALNRHAAAKSSAERTASAAANKATEELLANAVYQEDIDGSPVRPKRTPRQDDKGKGKSQPSPASAEDPDSTKKKNKWHDHDPYRLPELDFGAAVAKATSSTAPDPRLATEDELRNFIEEMVPEDFDIGSEAFRSLPTEVQYEIIGDLRLKSRQTSHMRLQHMLASAPTALDFSKAQIVNLKQRNALTQQLLATTETVGKVKRSTMPVRIAGERNRQYVLVRNTAADGGWVLGVRDEGTRAKPIDVDKHSGNGSEDSDDDADMEEIVPVQSTPDPDLREHQRSMALAAVGRRDVSKGLAPLTTRLRSNALSSSANRPIKSKPLFIDNGDDDDDTDFDPELEIALQQSLEDQEAQQIQTALEESQLQEEDRKRQFRNVSSAQAAGSTYVTLMSRVSGPAAKLAAVRSSIMNVPESPDGAYLASSSIGPRNSQPMSPHTNRASESPNAPISMRPKPLDPSSPSSPLNRRPANQAPRLSTSNLEQSSVPAPLTIHSMSHDTFVPKLPNSQNSGDDDSYTLGPSHVTPSKESHERPLTPISVSPPQPDHTTITSTPSNALEDDDDDLYIPSVTQREVPLIETGLQSSFQPPGQRATEVLAARTLSTSSPIVLGDSDSEMEEVQPSFTPKANALPLAASKVPPILGREEGEVITAKNGAIGRNPELLIQPSPSLQPRERDHGSPPRTSTSDVQFGTEHIAPDTQTLNPPQDDEEPLLEEWDATQEMDPEAEEGEFVQFMSQIRGRDIDAMRNEIDEELKTLHKQKKAAMRDSEDITQQMISQIQLMLRLFGIPYITAPMEAEAQCATLVSLGLVEGIITDDSDVFLFGGLRVFRNMFNQSKTVECFLLQDLARELGLDRDTLVRLAYLLGSDYTDGIPGVGPVLAMELMKEFPGDDGLFRFKEWWLKVQSGKDRPEDNSTPFRRRFKKRFKDLHLTEDWPPAVVRDAYYHPTVDNSEEAFKWGLPDLDALREFLNAELSWSTQKVDDTLLPIIRKVGQRGKPGNVNKQHTLETYVDASIGSGTYAPRHRTAYASKRLQKVVLDFRKQKKRQDNAGASTPTSTGVEDSTSDSNDEAQDHQSRRIKQPAPRGKGNGRGRGRARAGRGGAKRKIGSVDSDPLSDDAPEKAASKSKKVKAKAPRKKQKIVRSSEEDEDESETAQKTIPDRPLAVELRRRPKPKPRWNVKDSGDVDADKSIPPDN